MDEVDLKLLNHALKHQPDVIGCPASRCDYQGFISAKQCTQALECEKCSYRWRDPSQYTCIEKIQTKLGKCKNMDLKILT
jgi:hypothetical protein